MAASPWIFDVGAQDLGRLVEQSRQQPVLVDFWADWCQPCKQLAPILERLVDGWQGKLLLARVNADAEPQLAAQFGVRSLPTLKLLSQGQLVAELSGLQTEAALRDWLLPHLDPAAAEAGEIEAFLQQARAALEAGQAGQVVPALQQLLAERPQAHAARALLADCLLTQGQVDDARSLLAEITEDVPELKPCHARLALLDKVDGMAAGNQSLSSLAALAARADAGADDLYLYGLRAAASGQFRDGLEALLALLATHPGYRNGIARSALLDVFECLPKGDPLASEFRRRMFNHLH